MPERFCGAIIAGFDVHLRQITFDCLDSVTGEVIRGRIAATPAAVEEWVGQFPGREVHVTCEACTGWLFEPGRFSRRLRIEDDLSSGLENLHRCHDHGGIRKS